MGSAILLLADFQHNATNADFRRIFGIVGDHFWYRFQSYDANLLRLCDRMDDHNLAKLVAYLNSQGVQDAGQ